MLYSLFNTGFSLIKKVLFKPIVYAVDYFYEKEVHSKHEKIAKDVNILTCTPSAFLDKSRKEQVEVLAVDVMLLITNFSLIRGLILTDFPIKNVLFTLFYTYIATDLSSGLLHFTLDNPTTKNHPLPTVRSLAWQFQDHHDKPYDNTLPPLLHTLTNFSFTFVGPLIFNYIYSYIFNINMGLYSLFIYLFILSSQYVHRSIHYRDDQRSNIIKYLMRLKLVQNVENHHKHHKTFDCYYTTLSGWTDPVIHTLSRVISNETYEKTDWFKVCSSMTILYIPLTYITIVKYLL